MRVAKNGFGKQSIREDRIFFSFTQLANSLVLMMLTCAKARTGRAGSIGIRSAIAQRQTRSLHARVMNAALSRGDGH